MARALTNAHLTLNSVNLTTHVKSITLNTSVDLLDTTAMGDSSRERLTGLKDWSVDVVFHQSHAVGEVDATIWAVHAGGAAVTIVIRPDAGAKSTTNPEFTGSVVLENYSPIAGTVGDNHEAPIRLMGYGTLTRDAS